MRLSGVLMRCLLLALLALAAGTGPARAEDEPASGPVAFDDGVIALRERLLSGETKTLVDDFKALLAQHKEQDYVKARRQELEGLMLELACGAQFDRPSVKDLLGGKVDSWSAKTGKVKVRYTPKTADKLVLRDGLRAIPGRMAGPFTLEIKGSAYPSAKDATPFVRLGGDMDHDSGKVHAWEIACTPPTKQGRSTRVTVTIDHLLAGDKQTLSEKSSTLSKPGKPYKLVVKVSKTKIAVTLTSRSYGSAKKPAGLFGELSMRAGNWTEMKVTGVLDAGWIRQELAQAFRMQLAKFEADYDAAKDLPDWIFDPLDREESKPPKKATDLLANLSNKHYDLLQDVMNSITLEEYPEATKGIERLQAAGVPEAACELLRSQLAEEQTKLEDALAHMETCLKLEPGYLDGVLKRGELLQKLGRFKEALDTFANATGDHALFPSAYEQAAQALLMAGRPEDASRVTRAAARRGVFSRNLITLNDALAKVVSGPKWAKRFEHKSANYHVMSNMDAQLCREAAQILEDAFEAYRKTFGFVPRDKTRLFKVYLFDTQKGFIAYMGRLEEFMGKPSDQAAGVYSPLLKQLLIWNLPQRSEMLNTIRHEGFHQYLDRLMPDPPTWFNEGLAVYHENGRKEDGKMTFGHLHPGYVRLLSSSGLIPLDKFLNTGGRAFYEDGHRSYGQAWLLVHMLQHTTPAYRRLFDGMVADLKEGSAYNVVKKRFPKVMHPQLMRDLKAYLEKLERE